MREVKTRKIDIEITTPDGEVVFERKQFEIPEDWSDRAGQICASKYAMDNENSAVDIITRVVEQITTWGRSQGYFEKTNDYPEDCLYDATYCSQCEPLHERESEEALDFKNELFDILINQRAAFNSPVWFNCGSNTPTNQMSACFIVPVEDDMQSILEHNTIEGKIFEGGSGAGCNVSSLRGKGEKLSNRGESSGPISFMKMWDATAGVIKSAGKVRRAAKMVCMDIDHPDIEEFIHCKKTEEDKAKALVEAGISHEEAYATVAFQNTNHSIVVSDNFMEIEQMNGNYSLCNRGPHSPTVAKTVKAKDLIRQTAEIAWETGDPGIIFRDRVNRDNPVSSLGDIQSPNPCQPGFATVLTPEGIRTFDDIDVGSIIWSGKQWTKVTDKACTGTKPVNKYITTAGHFIGTENHKIFSNGERTEVKDAQSIDICNCEEFETNTIDSEAIVDGWVLGDGSIHKASNNLVYLNLGKEDIDTFINNYGDYYIKDRTKLSKFAHEIETTIKPCELVYTYEREVPTRYIQADNITKASFLRGLYNANGSVCGDRVTLKSTSFKLISDVQIMLSSLGISSYFTTNKKKKVKFDNGTYECKESYDLNITKDRDKFHRIIRFDHEHKKEKLNSIIGKKKGKPKTTYDIIKIEELGTFPVYDIRVEADEHSYWTGGLLVSNCSEFFAVNSSSCNLASMNLLKYLCDDNENFAWCSFENDIHTMITAMDIIIDGADYPTEEIGKITRETRPLGLGFSNLGALLMLIGYPYDSDGGRQYAKDITEAMTTYAYDCSIQLAKRLGSFKHFKDNRDSVIDIACRLTDTTNYEIPGDIDKYGIRNSQLTLLAPTGTISFMMDCDTTGIEPLFALKTYKQLSGGGYMDIDYPCVAKALELHDNNIDGLFKTANEIPWKAHIDMMAACQQHLNGAISKCVTADTIIPTEEGFVNIGSFYSGEEEDTFSPIDLKVDSESSSEIAEDFYYGGERDTIKVTLKDGRTIEGTPNHRIKTITKDGEFDWIRLDELEINQYIGIKLGSYIGKSDLLEICFNDDSLYGCQKRIKIPSFLTNELGWFLGAYIAEGNISKSNWTTRITNNNLSVLDKIKRVCSSLFGLEGKIIKDKRNNVMSICFNSKSLCLFLEHIGAGGNAETKEIPWSILQSPLPVIKEFIKGLWLDGYVRKSNATVAICLKSKKIIDQLQIILTSIGIKTNQIKKHNKEYDRFFYELLIHGEWVVDFNKYFGELDDEWKQKELDKHCLQIKDRKHNRVYSDVFPCYKTEIQNYVINNGERAKFPSLFDSRTENPSWNLIKDIFKSDRDITEELLIAYNIIINNIHFVQIESIENSVAKVYDFYVPDNNTFIGNGIINHNTVNMPADATVEDIEKAYKYAWKQGLKCLAIYRDGCKMMQPMSAKKDEEEVTEEPKVQKADSLVPSIDPSARLKPSDEREALTLKIDVGGHEGYVHAGMYPDGSLCEIFIRMSKEGSMVSGMMDSFATAVSLGLQHGVPLSKLVEKFKNTNFEPSGWVTHQDINHVTSIVDYIFQWLELRFIKDKEDEDVDYDAIEIDGDVFDVRAQEYMTDKDPAVIKAKKLISEMKPYEQKYANEMINVMSQKEDRYETVVSNITNDPGSPCSTCGGMTYKVGTCFICHSCGTTSGCS